MGRRKGETLFHSAKSLMLCNTNLFRSVFMLRLIAIVIVVGGLFYGGVVWANLRSAQKVVDRRASQATSDAWFEKHEGRNRNSGYNYFAPDQDSGNAVVLYSGLLSQWKWVMAGCVAIAGLASRGPSYWRNTCACGTDHPFGNWRQYS